MTAEKPGAPAMSAGVAQATAVFDEALSALSQARGTDDGTAVGAVLNGLAALLAQPGGFDALYERVSAFENAGIFTGTDWDHPGILIPELAFRGLRFGERDTTLIEILSQVRMLAVAQGDYVHPGIHAEHARHFLRQVMALNLDLATGELSEADRNRPERLGELVLGLYRFLLERLGTDQLVDQLAEEVWGVLAQRPVRVEALRHMITQMAVCLTRPGFEGDNARARALVKALFSPSPGTASDPGLEPYGQWLATVDREALVVEARDMGAAMRATGLVSPYHPVLLRHLRTHHEDLLLTALGLSSTGCDALLCFRELVHALIDQAVYPECAQSVYGLAMMLERALPHLPGVAPALWRQLHCPPCAPVAQRLRHAFGERRPPEAFLVADLLAVLGQPLGIGQGNHPTCQSARALAMWSMADPRRLLDLLYKVTRDDDLEMRFEGQWLSSAEIAPGTAEWLQDVDAVSLVMVHHLDRLYHEMGRRCQRRGGDPHRWVNPELHGDGVERGFRIAVNPANGFLDNLEGFIRAFYAAYHPFHNGDIPVVHPQPAGIAATDSLGRFVGWHAISIQRLALDADGNMRVYFYNPNNDSAQDWGQGIVVATHGNGEWPGEASLPVAEFVARLYAFHHDPAMQGTPETVPAEEVEHITSLVFQSWGAGR